jgi:hypothetical protein
LTNRLIIELGMGGSAGYKLINACPWVSSCQMNQTLTRRD